MGQYWYVVNLDKREFLHPHKLGCGLKLREQAGTHPGTGTALLMLLAAMPEVRGGGDFQGKSKIVGRWAGDRVALVGDYAEDSDLPARDRASKIQGKCDRGEWADISLIVARAIEKELGGKYSKDEGWRSWTKNGETNPTKSACEPDLVLQVAKPQCG